MSQQQQIVVFAGGLDLITPPMMVKPGFVIGAQNYEVGAKGYQRCDGYERYDGQPSPSSATYTVYQYTQGTALILAGETVTGLTSGATGIALADMTVSGGVLADGTANGSVALHAITGAFQDNEFLQVGGVNRCRCEGTGTERGATSAEEDAAFIAAVTTYRRNRIAAVPGTGPVRGVLAYRGNIWAFRDDSSGSTFMWKATTTGWVKQDTGWVIAFSGGMVEPAEGATITGATSGATATVMRVARHKGDWGAALAVDRAAGIMAITPISGTFTAGEDLTVGGVVQAIADGAATAVTIASGGKIRGIVQNFYGRLSQERLYFVNGQGRAHEWDGTTLTPIHTGLLAGNDKPVYIAAHRGHLALGYESGSIFLSSTGEPLTFDAVTGSAEIAFGHKITGLVSHQRDSLIIMARNKIGYLVGADAAEFDLKSLTESSGAVADTLQDLNEPVFLDDLGIRSLSAAQEYGDWNVGTNSLLIEPFLRAKRKAGILPVGSLRVRGKDQYRLYFADGSGIIMYIGRSSPEFMPILLPIVGTCFSSGERADGTEIHYAGSDDGYVYQLDRGTSFDGAAIEAYVRLSFLNQGYPNTDKRYHRGRLEGTASAQDTALRIAADYTYADADQPSSPESDVLFYGRGGFWDSANWNEFAWSAAVEGRAWIELTGIGENIALVFVSESATEGPHTLSTLTINWTPRRRMR